jgi:hypothetical protein
MNVIFGILVFIFERLGELSTIQGLTAIVTGSGVIKDPVHAFVYIGVGIIAIGVLGAFLPNEFAWLKGIAGGIRKRIEAAAKGSNIDLGALNETVAGLQADMAAIKPILAAQTASSTDLAAIATGAAQPGEKNNG